MASSERLEGPRTSACCSCSMSSAVIWPVPLKTFGAEASTLIAASKTTACHIQLEIVDAGVDRPVAEQAGDIAVVRTSACRQVFWPSASAHSSARWRSLGSATSFVGISLAVLPSPRSGKRQALRPRAASAHRACRYPPSRRGRPRTDLSEPLMPCVVTAMSPTFSSNETPVARSARVASNAIDVSRSSGADRRRVDRRRRPVTLTLEAVSG